MKPRKLSLRKETLTELSTGELHLVAAGSNTCLTYTLLPTGCACTGRYPSLNEPCPTTNTVHTGL